jgi:hypothetical protein
MKAFYYNYEKGFMWFRIFGYGVSAKDIRIFPRLFSERYGYTKYIMIGSYLIKYLPKCKL